MICAAALSAFITALVWSFALQPAARPHQAAISGNIANAPSIFAPRKAMLDRSGRPLKGPQGEGTAQGWSGYVVTAHQPYTSTAGSWNVPAVSYARISGMPAIEFSSTWVGIGGNADQTLVQLGTAQEVQSSGAVRY
jgi:hypothetical protein